MGNTLCNCKEGRIQSEGNSNKHKNLPPNQQQWNESPSYLSDLSAQKYLKDLHVKQIIGQGAFGQVFLVKSRSTKKFYAMKQIIKSPGMNERQVEYALNERRILSENDHPFLLKLFYSFQDSTSLYLITEYAEGADLQVQLKYKQQMRESEIIFYMSEVIVALEFLHDRGIIYRDLKPQNILITKEGHIKLADFGLSKILNDKRERSNSSCGTIGYIAPEILAGMIGHDGQVDLWSLGTTLYELYHGHPPFYSKNKAAMVENTLNKEVTINSKINPLAQDLIRRLLEPNPSLRITLPELKEHELFKDIDWEQVKNLQITPPRPISTQAIEKELKQFNGPSALKSLSKKTQHTLGNSSMKGKRLNKNSEQTADLYTQESLDIFKQETIHIEGFSFHQKDLENEHH